MGTIVHGREGGNGNHLGGHGVMGSMGFSVSRVRQADISLAGTGIFSASVIILHPIQPDLSVVHDAVSYYMNGPWGGLLGIGLVAIGAGSLSLWAAVSRTLEGASVGRWALALWGAGASIGGLFPPDPRGSWNEPPSLPGMIHGGAAMVAFLALPVAALLLSGRLGKASGRKASERLMRALGIATAVMLIAFFAVLAPAFFDRPPHYLGLAERLLLIAYAGWLAAAALVVRSITHAGSGGA